MVKLDDGKANTIVAAISGYLKEVHISLSHVSSFGSDGAAVMIGRNSGVSTQLKALKLKIKEAKFVRWLKAVSTVSKLKLMTMAVQLLLIYILS